jgi:hypothetical protein
MVQNPISDEHLRNPTIVGTIDEMKARITALSQISGSDYTDKTNSHTTALSGIPGSVVIGQINAHITTLSEIAGSVTTGKPMHM